MAGDEQGHIFREAWIAGVKKHYPGEPKPGYIGPWDEMPEWEQQSATAVFSQVHEFIAISDGKTDEIRRGLYQRVAAKAGIATSEDRATFVNAWYARMTRRGQLGDRFKNAYFVLLALSSLAAASVPALIGAAGSSHTTAGNVMRAIAAVLGVLVAITTSVLGVVQVGARRRGGIRRLRQASRRCAT